MPPRLEHALLVTAAASPFAELARWALDHAGVVYREERHLPILQGPAALARRGGIGPVSLALPDGRVLDEAVDVVRHADDRAGGTLLARGRPERAAVLEWEATFTAGLGPDTKRLLYAHLLTDRDLALRAFATDVPTSERLLFRIAHPALVALLRRTLPLDPAALERSERRVREVFDRVDEALAAQEATHGHPPRTLCGTPGPTAADLALAALASPVLWPEEAEDATRLPIDDLPLAYRDLVESFRGTRCGAFVRDLYRRERRRPAPAA